MQFISMLNKGETNMMSDQNQFKSVSTLKSYYKLKVSLIADKSYNSTYRTKWKPNLLKTKSLKFQYTRSPVHFDFR